MPDLRELEVPEAPRVGATFCCPRRELDVECIHERIDCWRPYRSQVRSSVQEVPCSSPEAEVFDASWHRGNRLPLLVGKHQAAPWRTSRSACRRCSSEHKQQRMQRRRRHMLSFRCKASSSSCSSTKKRALRRHRCRLLLFFVSCRSLTRGSWGGRASSKAKILLSGGHGARCSSAEHGRALRGQLTLLPFSLCSYGDRRVCDPD